MIFFVVEHNKVVGPDWSSHRNFARNFASSVLSIENVVFFLSMEHNNAHALMFFLGSNNAQT
jgi:GTP cyclohydrolase III